MGQESAKKTKLAPLPTPLLTKLSANKASIFCYTEGINARSEDRKVAVIAVLADGGWVLESYVKQKQTELGLLYLLYLSHWDLTSSLK
jgi:hypothetical protein